MERQRDNESEWQDGRSLGAVVVIGVVAMALSFVGCGEDQPGQKQCSSHSECEVGMVCAADEEVCKEVPCRYCQDDPELVCLENDSGDMVCSSSECADDTDCPNAGESCEQGKCVGEECSSDMDCPNDQVCTAFGKCTDPNGGRDTGVTDTGGDTGPNDGGTTDTGGMDTDGPEDDGGGETGTDKCANVNCPDGKVCNPSNGDCIDSNCNKSCPPSDGSRPDATKLHPGSCSCVECTSKSDCSGDKECRNFTCRPPCQNECSAQNQNCPSEKPFCISKCCVECVGKSDCESDQACVDGFCTQATNDCTSNPNACPAGTECNMSTGDCEQKNQSGGQMCDPTNPQSCPGNFEFCDPQSGTCQSAGGGGQNCGTCGSNCTCPGNATCQQFICTGCKGASDCPSGQCCVPTLDFCLPKDQVPQALRLIAQCN